MKSFMVLKKGVERTLVSLRTRTTLNAGMTERWKGGMAESRNGGKSPQILTVGMVESRNNGTAENHPKS